MANFTKNAIKQTFLELLNEKPLNQITVKDIVEECGINRNSFYYHFQDIPALIEEIIIEEADRIIENYPSIESIETCLTVAFHFAKQNSRVFLHIYNSVNRALYEQYLWKVCNYVVSTYVTKVFSNLPVQPSDQELIIQFYKCECFGMVIEWMEHGMNDDVQDKIKRLCELKKGTVEEMIEHSLSN